MVKVYLSGAMANCSPEEMFEWRNKVKELVPQAFFYDPTVRIYKKTHHLPKDIVKLDKYEIDCSNVLFLRVGERERQSWGSAMEVLYAWDEMKYIIVVWESPLTVSPWIEYHANEVHTTLEAGINSLKKIIKNGFE